MIQTILGYCDVKVTGLHSSNINIYSLLKKGDCVNHVDMWFVPKKPPATIDFTYYQTIFIVGIRTKTYNNKFNNWYTSIHHNYNISILCFTFAAYKFPCKGAKDYTISSKWNDNPFTVITKGTLIFQRLPVKQCNNIPEIMHTLEKPLMANTVRMEIPTYYDDGFFSSILLYWHWVIGIHSLECRDTKRMFDTFCNVNHIYNVLTPYQPINYLNLWIVIFPYIWYIILSVSGKKSLMQYWYCEI